MDIFNNYYQSTCNGRKLTWLPVLGNCTITGNFNMKPIDLIVTTHQVGLKPLSELISSFVVIFTFFCSFCQAAVLLLFNNGDTLTCSEIMTSLNLPLDDVITLLRSLSYRKCKILWNKSRGETITLNDQFEFNSRFTDEKSTIKVFCIASNFVY